MKTLYSFILGVFLCLVLSPHANAMGLISTYATHPITATGVPIRDINCLREGESSSLNILYLFEFGDAGIDAAAKCGCVRQITFVDKTESSFLFFFRRLTTHVYGL